MNIQRLFSWYANHVKTRNAMRNNATWIRTGDTTHHQLQSITSVTLSATKTMVRMVDQAILVLTSVLLFMIRVLVPL